MNSRLHEVPLESNHLDIFRQACFFCVAVCSPVGRRTVVFLLSSLQMPGTHSTGQLLLWLVCRRGLRLLHSLTHFFADGVAVLFCCLILVTTGSFFLFFDTRCSRVGLVSLDPRCSRIGLVPFHARTPTLIAAASVFFFFFAPTIQSIVFFLCLFLHLIRHTDRLLLLALNNERTTLFTLFHRIDHRHRHVPFHPSACSRSFLQALLGLLSKPRMFSPRRLLRAQLGTIFPSFVDTAAISSLASFTATHADPLWLSVTWCHCHCRFVSVDDF